MKPALRIILLAPALALAACASQYGPGDLAAGASREAVRERLGEPTGQYQLPEGGMWLEYARGPFGKHTYMVELAADGRVRGWAQVLTEGHFNRVVPGMRADELRRLLGRPAEVAGIWRGASVWSWRYESPFCQWFRVTLEPDGTVRDAGYSPDPICEVNDKEDHAR